MFVWLKPQEGLEGGPGQRELLHSSKGDKGILLAAARGEGQGRAELRFLGGKAHTTALLNQSGCADGHRERGPLHPGARCGSSFLRSLFLSKMVCGFEHAGFHSYFTGSFYHK